MSIQGGQCEALRSIRTPPYLIPPPPPRRAPFPAQVTKTDLFSSTEGAPSSAPWFLMLMANEKAD